MSGLRRKGSKLWGESIPHKLPLLQQEILCDLPTEVWSVKNQSRELPYDVGADLDDIWDGKDGVRADPHDVRELPDTDWGIPHNVGNVADDDVS